MEIEPNNQVNKAIKLALNNQIDHNLLFNIANDCLRNHHNQTLLHQFLDLAHFSNVAKTISINGMEDEWFDLMMQIISSSNYHFGYLLKQRSERYAEDIALTKIQNDKEIKLNFKQLWFRTIEVEKALTTFDLNGEKKNIGILSRNILNSVLVDFACLSFGRRVVPIPLNATSEHISYILKHSEIDILFVDSKNGAYRLNEVEGTNALKIINLENQNTSQSKIDSLPWDIFLQKGDFINHFDLKKLLASVELESVNTVMYTSGTTDNPKGITFTQKNLMSKRFARALALPNIGSDDIFLCYLPLFHTFGRFFELMGSIFWGSSYCFAQSPSFNSLLNDFKIVKPTIFISIPKRWVQLYEFIRTEVDIDDDDEKKIKDVILKSTGGQLKLGLSAAGYLDPEIFKFFQRYTINLLSGYGMTEATGGITMTPLDEYVEDSVGKGLPGIELKLEADGELCLRGPYISNGYLKNIISKSFRNGWFYTQDIFREENGHYFIIDRKKDIYKNSRGQTIAPQKIENLFHDFEFIKSVFLVGDGQEFNTVLIYPNYDNPSRDLRNLSKQKIRELFSSMILSVNGFLSPFERIVNYVIINRDFSIEENELTSKSTFKRKNILQNFKNIISPLYEKNYSSLFYNTKEIRIPNWLIREIGTIKTDLNWDGMSLSITGQDKKLILKWNHNSVQIGDFFYLIETDILQFDKYIQDPTLWLGNFQFSEFTEKSIFRLKDPKSYSEIRLLKLGSDIILPKVRLKNPTNSMLAELHKIVRQFLSEDSKVFNSLKNLLSQNMGVWSKIALKTLLNYQSHPNPYFRIKLLESIAPILSGDRLVSLLRDSYRFHRSIDSTKGFSFDIKRANEDHYESFIKYLNKSYTLIKQKDEFDQDFIKIVLLMVSDFGILHPTRFVWARSELINWHISNIPKPIYSTAQKAYYLLINGFRSWIGLSPSVTVDPETGKEYSWKDVIQFDDNVREHHRLRIIKIVNETSIVRESVFLFSKSFILSLSDIPLNGIWVTLIDNKVGKSVFRILIKTRVFGTHNIIINLNENLEKEFLDEETKLLIKMSAGLSESPLVENFGGYWPEYGIYSEEYVQGETVSEHLQRYSTEIKDNLKIDRWQMRWLHFIWNGIQAYQEFWYRSNYQYSIQPPSTENLIIPRHDYKVGTTLISISSRSKVESLIEHFIQLYTDYIVETEQKFPGLNKMSDWEVIFTATIQALKVDEGKKILEKLKLEIQRSKLSKRAEAVGLTVSRLEQFLLDIEEFGVLTKPVIFASLRYERWLDLNKNATLKARASILQELYGDYNLDSLLDEYPETRVRFFMMNCFKNSSTELTLRFQNMIKGLRKKDFNPWNLQDKISKIQSQINLNEDEKFFLARMLFPHVNSADYVELVTTKYGKEEKLNLVYQTECDDGKLYSIRPPFIPKEIAQFHTILIDSYLSSTFTSEHEFLLAFNNRNRIAGGLYWKKIDEKKIHLEWVAIKQKYQKISLSKRLMSDFFKRKKHQGIKNITVGFYAEEFFTRHGFKLDERFGGMVKEI